MENTLLKIKSLTTPIIFAISAIAAILLAPILVATYSPYYTHPDLTSQMALLYNNKNLGIQISNTQITYMRQGAINEDEPPRWTNHFYNPKNGSGWSGDHFGDLSQEDGFANGARMTPIPPMASVFWATNQQAQTAYRQYGNQTWQKAINSYLDGNEKEAFTALGHILHLVEDASVPDHTRDDSHADLFGDPGSPFERFTEQYTNTHTMYYSTSLQTYALPRFSTLSSALIDIAKYSNENFYSEDTILKSSFEFPKLEALESKNEFKYNPSTNVYLARYFEKDGEITYTTNNDTVLASYRDHLFPRVVLTGAGVIKLFFDEVQRYQVDRTELEPILRNEPSSFWDLVLNSPLGALQLPIVTTKQNVYDRTMSDLTLIGSALNGSYYFGNETMSGYNPFITSTPYSPATFKPSTGTLSIAKSNSNANLTFGTVANTSPNYTVDNSGLNLPFITNTPAIGEIRQYVLPNTSDAPGTAGYSTTLYAMAPMTLAGNLSSDERSILSQALAGIGIDNNPANAAATAMLLTTALAGLGYVVRTRTENGVSVFDIVKQVPRTVYENVLNTTNVLTPVTKQVVEYVTVPVSEWYSRPVQVIKNVVESAYQWVQEAVPVVKQVARTVYDYVTSWVPESVQSWIGGVWQTITSWVEKVVPIAKTVYDTVVETAYQWVQRPVQYVKQVMETVYESATRLVEKTIPVVRDVVEYVSTPVAQVYQRAKTVYDDIIVGTVNAAELPSAASLVEAVDVPVVPVNTTPKVPPNLFRDPYNGQYWMLSAGLSDFNYGYGGVARYIADQATVREIYGDTYIRSRPYGNGSNGWDPQYGGGTSGGAMTLDAMWRQLPEVFNLGTAAQNIRDYAKGVEGTGHQMGWTWRPVEMIDPRTNIIYSVDFTEDVKFQDQLGWRRTDTGLYTTEQLNNAVRSYEAYDSLNNYLAHKPYNGSLAAQSVGTGQPTAFQLYFQQQLALGRTAEDILANNPYMVGGALYQAPAGVVLDNYTYFNVPFKSGFTQAQMDSIQKMLRTRANQGWGLNATDAQNFAFAVGVANWQQFVGKSPNEVLALARPVQAWNVGAQTVSATLPTEAPANTTTPLIPTNSNDGQIDPLEEPGIWDKLVVSIGDWGEEKYNEGGLWQKIMDHPFITGTLVGLTAGALIAGGIYAVGGRIACGIICEPIAVALGGSAGSQAVKIGDNFGKLGTVIPNAAGKIENFSTHAIDGVITRGVSPQAILNTVRNPLLTLSQSSNKIAYLSHEAFVVIDVTLGKVVTVYGANDYLEPIKYILSLID